jgi:hypothetical protein
MDHAVSAAEVEASLKASGLVTTLRPKSFRPSQMTEHMFVGGESDALNYAHLVETGIEVILCCSVEHCSNMLRTSSELEAEGRTEAVALLKEATRWRPTQPTQGAVPSGLPRPTIAVPSSLPPPPPAPLAPKSTIPVTFVSHHGSQEALHHSLHQKESVSGSVRKPVFQVDTAVVGDATSPPPSHNDAPFLVAELELTGNKAMQLAPSKKPSSYGGSTSTTGLSHPPVSSGRKLKASMRNINSASDWTRLMALIEMRSAKSALPSARNSDERDGLGDPHPKGMHSSPQHQTLLWIGLPLDDVELYPLEPYFSRTTPLLQRCHKLGIGVLVHCMAGRSRSVSIAAAHLVERLIHHTQRQEARSACDGEAGVEAPKDTRGVHRKSVTGFPHGKKMTMVDAVLDYMRTRRLCICPNDGFYLQLTQYESSLKTSAEKPKN